MDILILVTMIAIVAAVYEIGRTKGRVEGLREAQDIADKIINERMGKFRIRKIKESSHTKNGE